jgi:hypothetical protein
MNIPDCNSETTYVHKKSTLIPKLLLSYFWFSSLFPNTCAIRSRLSTFRRPKSIASQAPRRTRIFSVGSKTISELCCFSLLLIPLCILGSLFRDSKDTAFCHVTIKESCTQWYRDVT